MRTKLLAGCVGTLIYVVLPLVAWGVVDFHGFLGNPARVAFLVITVLANVLTVVFVPNAGMSREGGETVIKRQRIAVVLLQVCTLGIIVVAPYADSRRWCVLSGESARYAGLVLYAAGLFLMNWAVVFLGRYFSVQVTVQKDHQLVMDGPYRVIRHPRYLGLVVCFAGVALVFASLVALGLAALLLAVLFWRIHDEELLMAKAMPDAWPGYAQKTARLIPGIY